jgi:hypothetical protein
MRIDGPGRANNVSRARDSKKGGRTSNVFSLSDAGRKDAAGASAEAAPIGGLDALLALQGVGDLGARGERLKHGHDMLDLLEDIKLSMLSGELPAAKLQSLIDTVSRRPIRFSDESVETVLDEIELRARVELAKLGREAA